MTKQTRAYIAGPMRGYPDYNFPAFDRLAEALRDRGVTVASPSEFDSWDESKPEVAIMLDLSIIINWANSVYALPGWKKSVGAKAEIATALWAGKHVLEVNEREPGVYDFYQLHNLEAS